MMLTYKFLVVLLLGVLVGCTPYSKKTTPPPSATNVSASALIAGIIPTPWFCAIACEYPKIDSAILSGNLAISLKASDTIKAYDPQGVKCGQGVLVFIPQADTVFKIILRWMPIYGDDYTTPTIDEGAKEGDTITFDIVHDTATGIIPKYRTYHAEAYPPLIWHHQTFIEQCVFKQLCCVTRGDINGDGETDIGDLSILIDFLWVNPGENMPCLAASDFDADKEVDIGDLTKLMSYLFFNGPGPSKAPCK